MMFTLHHLCAVSNRRSDSHVALAMAGELRTLTQHQVLHNLKMNVLMPLSPDTFLHVSLISSRFWFGQAPVQYDSFWHFDNSTTAEVQPIEVSSLEMTKIMEVLKPVFIAVKQLDQMHVPFFYRWNSLLIAIESEEHRRGSSYDWIFRTRPDTFYFCQFSHQMLAGSSSIIASDQFGLFPREAATVALSISGRFTPQCKQFIDTCVPEHLSFHGIKYKDVGFRFTQVYRHGWNWSIPAVCCVMDLLSVVMRQCRQDPCDADRSFGVNWSNPNLCSAPKRCYTDEHFEKEYLKNQLLGELQEAVLHYNLWQSDRRCSLPKMHDPVGLAPSGGSLTEAASAVSPTRNHLIGIVAWIWASGNALRAFWVEFPDKRLV